jgi:hypothetical protein
MPMNCWLLQGQPVIKEVAYATNQVFCQAPFSYQVSGFRFQVSEKNIEAETCWSEAEIPSEAKRQRGTLKPAT